MTGIAGTRSRTGTSRATIGTAALFLLLGACGDTTVYKGEDGKVVAGSDGTVTIEGKDGAKAEFASGDALSSASATAAVEGLPDFAPVYPGSKVIQTMEASDGTGGAGRVVVLETSDSLDKVMAFYDERIAKSGAKAQMSMNSPDSAMRGVETEGKMGTLLSVSEGGDMRTITITMGSESAGG